MAKEIEIDTRLLESDIMEMQTKLDVIKTDIDKMYEAVRILDSKWDGPSNDAFNQQFTNDYNQMKEICEDIQHVIKCLEFAKKTYNKCDSDIMDIVNSIKI